MNYNELQKKFETLELENEKVYYLNVRIVGIEEDEYKDFIKYISDYLKKNMNICYSEQHGGKRLLAIKR